MYKDLICKELNLDIYISGRKTQGESVLLLLKSSNDIIHSLLIDSFVGTNMYNPLLDILEGHHLKEVDSFIWTHPHEDHSKGIANIIDTYEIGKIVLPVNLLGNEKKYRISQEAFDMINQINCLNDEQYDKVYQAQTDSYLVDRDVVFCDNDEQFEFSIWFVTPISGLARARILNEDIENLNDFSVSVYYCIGDMVLYLGGDTENTTYDRLPSAVLKKMCIPNIVKLPHHGSSETDSLLNIYRAKKETNEITINIAGCTSYSSCGLSLPREEILNGYKEISQFVYRICPESDGDAILHINADLLNRTISIVNEQNYITY